MTGLILVAGRAFRGVPITAATCQGCAARFDGKLCDALPNCGGSTGNDMVVYEEVHNAQLLTEDPDHGDPAVSLTYNPAHGGYPQGPRMPLASEGAARTTDPEPSHKAAARVGGGKLVDLMLVALQTYPDGLTGKEFSERLGKPLNSITPRLAPMRRAGYIHAAGTRTLQTVWKLGNGVKA